MVGEVCLQTSLVVEVRVKIQEAKSVTSVGFLGL